MTSPSIRSAPPTAPVLVTGGTGTLGSAVVRCLSEKGVPVRVLSRSTRPEGGPDCEWATGDLTTGAGIDAAAEGARAVIHCATTMGGKDVAATRQLTESAARTRSVSPHLVYISIVGVDRVPFFYYRAKLAAERVVEDSALPWTILRATQFHDLVARLTTAQRRLPVTFSFAGVSFQPVDTGEVAARLVQLALGEPAGRAEDMGGPEVRTARDLAGQTLRAYGMRGPVVPLRVPGRTLRGYRAGEHLAPGHALGRITYADYLAADVGPDGRRAL